MSTSFFRLEPTTEDSQILKLIFDSPDAKVNKLSKAAMAEFAQVLEKLKAMSTEQVKAVILISGKPGNFIAGADIDLIQKARTEDEAYELSRGGQKLLDLWEDLPMPTVVAIDGAALGGGCEISLASQAIVMSTSSAAKIGLPEVMLGIIPGMGGCVRMPRKVGLASALDLILTGRTLSGEKAYKLGLADALIQKEDFETSAIHWVKANLAALLQGKRLAKEPKLGGMGDAVGSALEHTPMGQSLMLKKAKDGVMEKSRGKYPAPLEAIEVLRDTDGCYGAKLRGAAREEALEREARGFAKMAATSISKNLIRIFFLTEAVKKSKGVDTSTQAPFVVHNGAVLGAGVMGGGIAQLMADRGVMARMKDISNPALVLGAQAAAKIFKKSAQKRKITQRQWIQKMNLIAPTLDFQGFAATQIVVEAVIEKMDVKKSVLADLENHVSKTAIIASNTSSLSITEMQSVLKNPERFGGMHFFNPVHMMPLVEVIRGEKTSDATVSAIYQFSKQLGKTPIVVKDAPGFLVNRLLLPYLNEATWMLADQVNIEELDAVILDFGMPMGPFQLIDEVGIDVGAKVAHILEAGFGERMKCAPYNDKVAESGRLGKKNQKGFYKYDAQGKRLEFDPSVYEVLGAGGKKGALSHEEMVDRCILPMINEASRCLEEGIVRTAEEVDLGMIMGTGFPPFRGGLLRYADEMGLDTIIEKLRHYEQKFGARYAPAPALIKRAERKEKFHSA